MKTLRIFFFYIILILNVSIICAIFCLYKMFPNAKIEELLYAISSPIGTVEQGIYKNFILYFIFPAFALFTFCFFLALKVGKKFISLFTLLVSLISIYLFLNELDFYDYLEKSNTNSNFIENNYVDPNKVNIVLPENKRNVIFIVLESMELSYADKLSGGVFDDNRITNLTNLAKTSDTFNGENSELNGFIPMYGTTWTMGASFGFNTGLPLKISLSPNSMATQNHFFSNVKALGDILLDNGYKNYVLLGSDATFAGTELFFKEHGDYDIFDYKYAIKNDLIPKDYYVWWGYEDSKLYLFAKQKLSEISQKEQPFNFTMYTMDTHMKDGYLSEHCPIIFNDKYSNVINCSSLDVVNFVKWIKQQDFYRNTTIVIVGDHLTMDSDYAKQFPINYRRKAFVSILNSNRKNENNRYREYTTFDLFPTIIASIGGTIEGDRLGLGVNLYSNTPTIIEQIGFRHFYEEIYQKSLFMERLSAITAPNTFKDSQSINRYISELNSQEKTSYLNLISSTPIKDYFSNLKNLLSSNRYFAVFSARNGVIDINSSNDIQKRTSEILHDFGLKTDFLSNKKASYIALINGSSTEEFLDNTNLISKTVNVDNHLVKVVSAGVGNYAYINIDDMEASLNGYGLNVVVFDKVLSQIISSEVLFGHKKQ